MAYTYDSLIWIPLLPLLGAAVNGLVVLMTGGRGLPKTLAAVIGLLAPVFSFLTVLSAFTVLRGFGPESKLVYSAYTWMAVGGLDLPVHLTFDALSAVMCLVVTGVGSLIHLYSVGYMERDDGVARYFTYLNLFMFAMLVLVLGSSLPILFVGWEGVGLCSYLLIGFWHTDANKAAAGLKAFVVNRIGDFGFLVGMFFLFKHAGTLSFAGLASADLASVDPAILTAACLFLFVGAAGKSAQIPLFVWLPDAMAGPTPVSALIHAATMVTAGVYMVCRLSFLYVMSPTAMMVVACIGAATAIFAATIGIVQNDIKKVLAYSTVSQLGFMFLAAGCGAFTAAIFHLVTHAFFKACLFLGSGSVIHAMHHAYDHAGDHESDPQDIRNMGGLFGPMKITGLTFGVSTLAIAGFPLTAGFFSKDEILWRTFSLFHNQGDASLIWLPPVLYGIAMVAALCTAIYMGRVFLLTFAGSFRGSHDVEHALHESPSSMTIPLIVLGIAAVAGGWIGVPHTFETHLGLHIPNLLEQWLHPIVGGASAKLGVRNGVDPHSEWAMTLIASGVGIAGLGVSFFLWFKGGTQIPGKIADGAGALYRLLLDKYRIDELYDAVVIRPLMWLSDLLLHKFIDRLLIDTIAVGIPVMVVKGVGAASRGLQTGNAQWYAGVITLGIAVFLAIYGYGA